MANFVKFLMTYFPGKNKTVDKPEIIMCVYRNVEWCSVVTPYSLVRRHQASKQHIYPTI